ncbi:unnamed protein product [Arctia plantaginis]|uniref:Uncharacterized protein n=1 Tax=Arctia plantaginis TaxID=874455 RepID=A0A8S1BGE2_ARCPL|nr:unnamed protein product [Arctia plantaginis]
MQNILVLYLPQYGQSGPDSTALGRFAACACNATNTLRFVATRRRPRLAKTKRGRRDHPGKPHPTGGLLHAIARRPICKLRPAT